MNYLIKRTNKSKRTEWKYWYENLFLDKILIVSLKVLLICNDMCLFALVFAGALAWVSVCFPVCEQCWVGCRGQLPAPSSYPLALLIQDLSLNLELATTARLACQRAPRIFLSLPPQLWGYRCVLPCLALPWVLGTLVYLQQVIQSRAWMRTGLHKYLILWSASIRI